MIFSNENVHRRKSSLAPSDATRTTQQRANRRKDTACRVHKLLGKERQSEKDGGVIGLDDTLDGRIHDKESENGSRSTYSRLLTKKQLSDMAWGVRELSKKLGSLRLKLKVETVFLLTKAHDEEVIGYTRRLAEWLLSKERETPYTVYAYFQADNRYQARVKH